MKKTRIGLIGCGSICGAYFKNAKSFDFMEIVACADLDLSRAQAAAKEFNVPKACRVDELLADPAIEIIINLTVPLAHAKVSLAILNAGKHVWTEKPLTTNREDGLAVLAAAKKNNLRVGGAPDTFLGAAHQTARKLIDDGAIGRPIAATAFMMCRGHEGWHPNPEFHYKPGAGPMWDMGPYYLTDLLQLMGPAQKVTSMASIGLPERTITHKNKDGGPGPFFGQKITVETPDHVAGNILFENGCVATVITSLAVHGPNHTSPITIFGSEGSIQVSDPNRFDDPISLFNTTTKKYEPVEFTHTTGYGRSVGLADMAKALQTGRRHRANETLLFNVQDIMQAFLESAETDKAVEITTPFERPAPLPTGLKLGEMD